MRFTTKTGTPTSRVVNLPLAFVLYILLCPSLTTIIPPSLRVGVLFAEASSVAEGDDGPSSSVTAVGTSDSEYPNLYDESIPMLWASRLVYAFADVLEQKRAGVVDFDIPPEFMKEFKDNRFDVRSFNGGHGLKFSQIIDVLVKNYDQLQDFWGRDKGGQKEHDLAIIENLREVVNRDPNADSLFLEVFDSIKQEKECVYAVAKDEIRKRVIIVFRGSVTGGTMDWARNLEAFMTEMRTPKLLQAKLEGRLKHHVRVHRGFYNYLFNNEFADGAQVYDRILDDVKPFLEKGYKIYVTGHSLGAALSSLLAFKIAGSDKEWISKPVTCISYASPYVGSDGFRTAFTELERAGFIRYLRITNSEDVVPAIPFITRGFRKRTFKHVGIHLCLSRRSFNIVHPRNSSGLRRALGNSVLTKRVLNFDFHGLKLHDERMNMDKVKEALQNTTINELYEDENLVGSNFFRGTDEL